MAFKNQNLGIGVGLRPVYYNQFLDSPPKIVSWVEVVSESYMRWENGLLPQAPLKTLEKVRGNLPVFLHGVSLSIGSTDPLNKSHLKRLKELVERIDPAQVSDHLCWTGVESENLHDLLPLPYTEEALKHVSQRIVRVQEYIGRRLLIENVSSYVEFESEMSEWEFISEVAKRSDCGILLDVNNVYVSSQNHNFDPLDYLKAVPYERVGQIHLAGHTRKNSYLIDTHDEPVCPEVWDLYRWVIETHGPINTMIERDDNFPRWEVLEQELQVAKRIFQGKGRDYGRTKSGQIAKSL